MTQPEPSRPAVPERINGLAAIAANLAWSWNRNARALFRLLDAPLWRRTQHNPIELLRRVDPARLAACAADPAFLGLYDAVAAAAARDATSAGTWFATSYPQSVTRSIAYFCAEFGLHASVPIYSGGLGVLAGDQCKAASDLGVPLVGVGLFYTRGYSDQRLRLDGWQEDAEERFDVAATPLERVRGPKGDPCLATVRLSGRHVSVGAWRVMVGRVPIFLLDTDLAQNDPADRGLSHRLYAGGPDLRLRQEWILGVGGVRVLRALGYDPAVWHANEGHAAFMLVERVRELVTRGTRSRTPSARSGRRARSRPTRRCPPGMIRSRSSRWSSASVRCGRRWESAATRSSASATIRWSITIAFTCPSRPSGSRRGSTRCRAATGKSPAASGPPSGPTATSRACRSGTSPTASTSPPGWRIGS